MQLNQTGQFSHGQRSDGSPPVAAPMQEMNQMEIQFNTPQQQAAMIAEQQRAAAIQQELSR